MPDLEALLKRLEHAKTFLEGTQFSYRQVRNVVETTCPCDLRLRSTDSGFVVRPAGREKTKPRGLSIVRGGRGVAGRTVALLGAIFTYAVRQAFGSTIRCMVSSNSPKGGDSDVCPMMSTECSAWRYRWRIRKMSGSQPPPPHG